MIISTMELHNHKLEKRIAAKVIVLLIWLLLWQSVYLAVGQDLLLASPLDVCRRIAAFIRTFYFWKTVSASLMRILCGFLLAVFSGAFLAVLTSRFQVLYDLIALPMNMIKAAPVASFVILALIWIRGQRLSVFISFLMVLPLVWRNVHDGILAADPQLLEMAQVYCLPPKSVWRAIIIPAVLPRFLTVIRTGAGFAWKAGIAGEVIAIPNIAIGTELYHAKVYLETTDLFAWTFIVILLSILLERLSILGIQYLSRFLCRGMPL